MQLRYEEKFPLKLIDEANEESQPFGTVPCRKHDSITPA